MESTMYLYFAIPFAVIISLSAYVLSRSFNIYVRILFVIFGFVVGCLLAVPATYITGMIQWGMSI